MSRAIAEWLWAADVASAVIDLDELGLVHPKPRSFERDNLVAIWPNYAAIPGLKVVLSGVVADEEELKLLRDAAPASTFVVCELTAPVAVLKDRVTAREPTVSGQRHLRDFVDLHSRRTDLARIRDFHVSTHDTTVEEAAAAVIEKAGWQIESLTPRAESTADPRS